MKKYTILVFISFLFSVIITTWSRYFVEYSYFREPEYGQQKECLEQPINEAECIPLFDRDTKGFPFQFWERQWNYELNDKPLNEDTLITVEERYIYPLLAANVIFWAALFFTATTVVLKIKHSNSTK